MFRERKRRKYIRRGIRIAVVILAVAVIIGLIIGIKRAVVPKVILKAESVSILQEEGIPQIKAKAVCENKKYLKKTLEKGYTVKNFVKDLNEGKGYQLTCDADTEKEGSYPIKISLEEKWNKKLEGKWKRNIKLELENGTLYVKNKYGNWKDGKFQHLDGSYAAEEFIPSKGNMYYFNKEGEKVTGWQKIGSFRYFFDKKGVMDTGWKEEDGKTYYLQDDGKMAVGWKRIGSDTYYFDKEGKMVTGKQTIAKEACKFDKEGKLISKESKVNPDKPMIALTFDDGPGKYTDALLQKLEEYGARATFFMVGQNAVKYPETIQKMEAIGCELGNHSMTHQNLVTLDEAGIRAEIENTQEAIAAAVGHGGSILRPPYGEVNDTVKKLAHLPLMLWSVDTLDWKKKDAELITEYVLNTVSDGDVVLMHDSHGFSVEAALNLIPELTSRGYQLVTVSELAEARGVALKDGEKYSQFYKGK